MSVRDQFTQAPPALQAEIDRLRALHGEYELALQIAVKEKLTDLTEGKLPTPPAVEREVERLLGEAHTRLAEFRTD